jgi:inorganic pyrophosphatase
MSEEQSVSLGLARQFLGKEVEVTVDRPVGSTHPKHGYIYEANYGFLAGIQAPDGEDLDAYFLGTKEPLSHARGVVKAIIHRFEDDDDKLVVVPKGIEMSDQEIEEAVRFQEQWFKHETVRI